MKKILIIPIIMTLISCGPSEQEIYLAQENYNQNFLSTFDEEKATKEGCWSEWEFMNAAYIDGKLDTSTNLENKDQMVFLQTKMCISDILESLESELTKVKENEILLECANELLFSVNSWEEEWELDFPFYILFSVFKDSQDSDEGEMRFIRLKEIHSPPYLEIKIDSPYSSHKWLDIGGNKAKYIDEEVNSNNGLRRTNIFWLDRESLVFTKEFKSLITVPTNKWQCKNLDKKMLPNLVKNYLVEALERNKAKEALDAERQKERQRRELEKKEKRQL